MAGGGRSELLVRQGGCPAGARRAKMVPLELVLLSDFPLIQDRTAATPGFRRALRLSQPSEHLFSQREWRPELIACFFDEFKGSVALCVRWPDFSMIIFTL